jgi:cytoskeletal protein CcmA (bactofilin family)
MVAERPGERAIIGPSITIKGDVTGEEDLVIQGRVEGKVDLAQHNVTVGSNGRIKANIFGRSVTVEGEVEGDLHAEEQIAIRKSGKVRGNVSAPRVTIEDGAMFKGAIDMERKAAPKPIVGPVGAATAGPAPGTGGGPSSSVSPRTGEPRHPERSG